MLAASQRFVLHSLLIWYRFPWFFWLMGQSVTSCTAEDVMGWSLNMWLVKQNRTWYQRSSNSVRMKLAADLLFSSLYWLPIYAWTTWFKLYLIHYKTVLKINVFDSVKQCKRIFIKYFHQMWAQNAQYKNNRVDRNTQNQENNKILLII